MYWTDCVQELMAIKMEDDPGIKFNWAGLFMRLILYVFSLSLTLVSMAVEFTGPASWKLVNTNAVAEWQGGCKAKAGDDLLVLNGVAADRSKREVRLLAEAVGNSKGTIAEFLLVGPVSDRAYESALVTVASPGDIVKAVEFIGIKRGSCVDGTRFKFVPCGERFELFVRRLNEKGAKEESFSSLLEESTPDDPLYPAKGFVFAGGEWTDKGGREVCLTGSVPPCSVVSLYNESSVFDLPGQAAQSSVYGRLMMKEDLPYGTLLEVIVRPVSSELRVRPVEITAFVENDQLRLHTQCKPEKIDRKESVKEGIDWLRDQSGKGNDLFVTLSFDGEMTVSQARDAAALFDIINGNDVNLYGKQTDDVYYRAFLPQDSWRKREGRNPQPFEVHLSRGTDGTLEKKLVFIEEDWSVAGLEPKLTPKEYVFNKWSELEPLVVKAGGAENRVAVVFFFAPADMKLSEIMPGVNALSKRLPLVHIFAD